MTKPGSLSCVQFTNEDHLNEIQYSEVSRLIYETDDYIYPAVFENENNGLANAVRILPAVFESGRDPMFSKENLFAVMSSDDIVGLILWYKGSLEWTPDIVIDVASQKNIALIKDNAEQVGREYVSDRYNIEREQEAPKLHLINVCVSQDLRGQGVAGFMMDRFIKAHLDENMELVVLADNIPAIRLYKKYGFRVVQECDGFSLTDNKPSCLLMERDR